MNNTANERLQIMKDFSKKMKQLNQNLLVIPFPKTEQFQHTSKANCSKEDYRKIISVQNFSKLTMMRNDEDFYKLGELLGKGSIGKFLNELVEAHNANIDKA